MNIKLERTRAQKSRNAIERLYVTMRHLFNRGFYKPNGISGASLKDNLLVLQPEIYGSIANEEKVELKGLRYIIERLPKGVEECQFIHLTSSQGLNQSNFKPIVPKKRRRICYRIDQDEMVIEITRGRSEIYDILTHITFMFIEANKIMKNAFGKNLNNDASRSWKWIEKTVLEAKPIDSHKKEIGLIYLSQLLGRSYKEVRDAYRTFREPKTPDRLFQIIYWLGKKCMQEHFENKKIEVRFGSMLRERIGHHLHGELWANQIKKTLNKHGFIVRPIHIISANMHSFMNQFFAEKALREMVPNKKGIDLFTEIGLSKDNDLHTKVFDYATENGMTYLEDKSGFNINVQLFDIFLIRSSIIKKNAPMLLVMDYAFGEQAYEAMEELLKPLHYRSKDRYLNIESISIMGKAGVLKGGKGDIIIPSAHIFEGTADNYPIENELTEGDFEKENTTISSGAMITVLGTSLQNKDILEFFKNSTWNAVGLEMEGAHYQKAIQAASKIRKSISPRVKVRYAYYASDNPLKTGSTLASGGLGITGIETTYLITQKIIEQILETKMI